jgi:ABC-type phosphate transport system substrate-binding protein
MKFSTQVMNKAAGIAAGLALTLVAGAALAEVVAVVSAKSPVATLSKSQAVDIFLGKANRFPDGGQAVPLDQIEGSASRDEFYANVAGKSPVQVRAHWAKIIFTGKGQPPQEAASGAELRRRVANNVDAIGYLERSLVDASVKVLQLTP